MYVCVCMGVCCIGPNEGISMCNVEGNMKIHWEAPASLKTELLSGNLAPLVSIFFLGLRGVFHVVLSHIVDCAGKVSCVFQRVCSDWKDADNLERTMQHVCRCYQCFVQLDSAQSSTLWRPEMSMHYLWNHQLFYAGADVFDGYIVIGHQLSKRQYPVTIYALEGVTCALMRPFPFTLFAHKFRWISGMDSPTSSFSHLLLQCEEISQAGQILLITPQHESWLETPCWVEQNNVDKYSEAKHPPRSGIWQRSRCYKEDRVTGAAITQESRGMEKQQGGGALRKVERM